MLIGVLGTRGGLKARRRESSTPPCPFGLTLSSLAFLGDPRAEGDSSNSFLYHSANRDLLLNGPELEGGGRLWWAEEVGWELRSLPCSSKLFSPCPPEVPV